MREAEGVLKPQFLYQTNDLVRKENSPKCIMYLVVLDFLTRIRLKTGSFAKFALEMAKPI